MLVKVFIKRRFPKENATDVFELIKKLRHHAMEQKGYVSGETLIEHNDPETVMVLSTWESVEDWRKWKSMPERVQLDAQLEPMLESPTEYIPYVLSKYYLRITSEGEML